MERFCHGFVVVFRDVASIAPSEIGKCHHRVFGVISTVEFAEQIAFDQAAQERVHADAFARGRLLQRLVLFFAEVDLRTYLAVMLR